MKENGLKSKGARLVLSNIGKTYKNVAAIGDVSLDIEPGEFLTLLGPSGSGKTTTLNVIAGFVQPDRGMVQLGERDITLVAPDKRDIGIVFQNYALFPHLSAVRNVMFPLEMRGIKGKAARARATEALEMVELSVHADKLPSQLSGGQQQRVALARAFLFEPGLLLMDEPLGALDKNLRKLMQIEIMKLCKRVGSTVVYVTHDQEEALTMSDRVAVYNGGRIEQLATPSALYDQPETVFVARFIGESSLLDCTVAGDGTSIAGKGWQTTLSTPRAAGAYKLVLRPEMLDTAGTEPDSSAPARTTVTGTVTDAIYLGSQMEYVIRTQAGEVLKMRTDRARNQLTHAVGESLAVAWNMDRGTLLP